MPRLALYFLGAPRLELDGVAVSLSYSQAVAFLAYLSLTRQPYTRQALAALLWPDYEPASAQPGCVQKARSSTRCHPPAAPPPRPRSTSRLR